MIPRNMEAYLKEHLPEAAAEIAPQARRHSTKFSTDADNLLRESAFCFIPASPVLNYLGVAHRSLFNERKSNGKLVGHYRGSEYLFAGSEPQSSAHPHGADCLSPERGYDRK
jgi:hypothetical protein